MQCWEKQSGCATLLFTHSDQARRFKSRYSNHSIGERTLNITYPHNNSNHYHHNNSNSSNWRRGKSPYRSQQSYNHSRARTRSPSGGRFQQREAMLCQQQRSVSHDISNCRIVDIEAKKSEAVAVSLEEEDSAVILAERIAQDLALSETEPTQANSVGCLTDHAQLTRLQQCPVTLINPLPTLLTTPEHQQENEKDDATTSQLRDCKTTMKQQGVTPHVSNKKQSLLDTSDSIVVVGNGETNSQENDDISPLVSPVLSPPPSPKFRPIVLLLYVLDCDREPCLVSRRVSEELAVLNRRTLLSVAPGVLSAAALYRDVAVRIGCANHDDAGLLLDNLQTRLHYLTLDDRAGGAWVKKYSVRSEFLSDDDKQIYRIGRTIRHLLQEEARPGTSLPKDYFFSKSVNFSWLRKRFAKNYGGDVLLISDVQQLGFFVVEGSTAETFRVRLMTETRRNYIFR